MRGTCSVLVISLCVSLSGCSESKPAAETLPELTLVERNPQGSTMMLRFCFTKLDRLDWKNRVLRAQVVKSGEKPKPGGPQFANPAPEFTIKVLVGKPTGTERVLFVPHWGKSMDGLIGESEPFDFAGTDDSVTVTGTAGRRLTQILKTCTGPNRTVPFDPKKGVDLLTVGFKPNAWSFRVWVETVLPAQ